MSKIFYSWLVVVNRLPGQGMPNPLTLLLLMHEAARNVLIIIRSPRQGLVYSVTKKSQGTAGIACSDLTKDSRRTRVTRQAGRL